MDLLQLLITLRTRLQTVVPSVRLSSIQTQEQFMQELRAINPDKMPAAVVVFDGGAFQQMDSVVECKFTVVIVDRFRADSDQKAIGLMHTVQRVMEVFPADGVQDGDFFIHPTDITAATPDPAYAAVAIGLNCKQSF